MDVVNFSFIYDLVENTYSFDNDRHSLDLIMLIKIPLFQYFHIRSINH
ncbi:putative transposase [Streptococcus mutans A19]|nr:putative transposase [Streptococcus mutans A19]EMB92851.1 putative transposase [Streptococcus mutans U138]